MAECYTPFQKKDGDIVPCGKCENCGKRKVSSWSFRLMQEDRVSETSYFITLTYDTKYVPITPKGYMSLGERETVLSGKPEKARDLQLFFKRLRKANKHTGRDIKYYAVGEYGEKSFRPHYHIILFNVEIHTVEPSWGMGDVHYGYVSQASVGYTLKYISKARRIPLHKNDDRVPEFSIMSKGLGASYLNAKFYKWHHADPLNRMYCDLKDGKKISMPRYYKLKLYSDELRKEIGEATRKKMLLKKDVKKMSKRDRSEAAYAAQRRQARPDTSNNKI